MVLKIDQSIGTSMVILQKLFTDICKIDHSVFNFYWLEAKKKEIKIIIGIQKELTNKIVIKHKTDFFNHPYIMILEIRKLDLRSKKPEKKTQTVNVYDNQFR